MLSRVSDIPAGLKFLPQGTLSIRSKPFLNPVYDNMDSRAHSSSRVRVKKVMVKENFMTKQMYSVVKSDFPNRDT